MKLEIFEPTTADEIKSVLIESGIKTSCEDPLPAEICKEVTDEMLPALVILVNMPLSEGSMEGIISSCHRPSTEESRVGCRN